MRTASRWLLLASLLVMAMLGGCAMTRKIDSDVQSFAGVPTVASGASYRFERLPSQANARGQDQIEAMAATALAKVGLRLDPVSASYSVQVNFQSLVLPGDPHFETWVGAHGPRGDFFSGGFGMFMESPWYRYTVQLLVRDTANRVAYDTTATFESPWSDSRNLIPVILDAALAGFPNPPAGPRKVVIELQPDGAAR